ncbi:MAG: hypothetical protein JSV77_07545 [Dehalococcoidales bacterium]|nr:MAG: hypothetical protein JSV77_07545 [Dehalococcoidales bacterium]
MRRPQYPGKKFLGNINSKEVHDLDQEDTSGSGCQIDEIVRAGHAVTFDPDILFEAHRLGYDNCAKCLGGSHR